LTLTKDQFAVLTLFEEGILEIPVDQSLIQATRLPPEIIIKTVNQLRDFALLNDYTINANGLEALEPFRVKRGIFIAAGFGSRLVPITLNTPKPLVRVKGMRIIDTMLDALVAVGIQEVIIVRGYLGEQFDQLLYKYPHIKFVENQNYAETNNISSAMCVRHKFGSAYIMEGDLVLRNPRLISKYQYANNYLGVPVEITDDWCLESKDGFITKMKLGGQNCHHMFGISYWTEDDGTKLADHIKQAYEMPGGKERYWDQVPLEYFHEEYKVGIRECTFEDITEVDTFSELRRLDETYRMYNT
jgi:CTP:phosphocholine cytidylyltransferase-like protein